MAAAAQPDLAALRETLYELLRAHPQGLSEYELLNLLRTRAPAFAGERRKPLVLFQQHFLLFHCLYSLQQALQHAPWRPSC